MRPKALSGSIAKYSRGLVLSALTLIGASQAPGAIYYWDNSGGTANDWGSLANWSTVVGGGTDPSALPGTADVVTFSASPIFGTNQTVNLNADRSVRGLDFLSGVTTTTTLLGGNANRNLTIGASGITNASTGAVSIGSAPSGVNGQYVNIIVAGSQSWANNGNATMTIGNENAGTFSTISGTGSPTLTFNGLGNGKVTIGGRVTNTVTKVVQDSATSILSLRNSNNSFANLEIKKGTVEMGNGGSALGAGAVTLGFGSDSASVYHADNGSPSYGNSFILVAGGTRTIGIRADTPSAYTATFTGGVTGTGNLTIDNNGGDESLIFSTNQLNFTGSLTHIGAGTGSATISSVIGPLVTGVTQGSASSVLILAAANTYSGTTKANAGVLRLNHLSALQNSALDTSGAGTVDANAGTGNYVFGGLISGTNLATVITNGTRITTLTLNPQSGSVTYNNAIANLSTPMALTKSGAGTQVLGGANTYTGNTLVSVGTLQFAKQVSLYNNGAAATWSKTNINVNSGATMAFNIGGTGEFTNANIVSLLGLADATTNGFKTGAILGLDTTSGDVLFNSVIANPFSGANVLGLTKLGTNKLTLDQANTYTGVTTVSNGTLTLNRTAANNTTILTDGSTATTSDIVINGGTLELAASEQIRNTGSINMTSGAFNFGAATGKTETIDKFTNSGGTFSTGANILIGLGNTHTWSGGTNTVNNGGNVRDGHIVISGGTNTVEGGATGGVLELLNTAPALLEMSNGATLTLNADAAFAGKLLLSGNISTIGDATVTIASAGGGNPGNIDLNSGTRTFAVANGTAATDMSISARITNTGSIIKDGPGTLSLDASNDYVGTTTINNGTLIANALGALPLSSRTAVSFGGGGGTLTLGSSFGQSAASLTSAGAATVALGSNTLTVGIAGGPDTTFAGSIGGTGNLIKDTNSKQILSGSNGYTGTTTVSAGTLEVTGTLSGTTAVTVNDGGTLLLNSGASNSLHSGAAVTVGSGSSGILKTAGSGNTGTSAGALTLTSNSTIDFSTGNGNTLTFASLASLGSAAITISNWTGSRYTQGTGITDSLDPNQDRLVFSSGLGGAYTDGQLFNQITFTNDSGGYVGFGQAIAFGGGNGFEIVPVPEPATTALIGSIALCALIGYRERRRFTGLGKRMAARK